MFKEPRTVIRGSEPAMIGICAGVFSVLEVFCIAAPSLLKVGILGVQLGFELICR